MIFCPEKGLQILYIVVFCWGVKVSGCLSLLSSTGNKLIYAALTTLNLFLYSKKKNPCVHTAK